MRHRRRTTHRIYPSTVTIALLLVGGSGLCTCQSPPPPDLAGLYDRAAMSSREYQGYDIVRVYYATDRKRTGEDEPYEVFGDKPSQQVELGFCEVSIPFEHDEGELERPIVFRRIRENPVEHIVLLRVHRMGRAVFYSTLCDDINTSSRRQAFVFIHGFNTTFEEAARRTAQLAYDLEVDGAAIMYSWPSRYRLIPKRSNYQRDEDYVIGALPHMREFLKKVAAESGAAEVHVLAHSMGNRALTFAIEALAAQMSETSTPHFHQVILLAPDINANVFKRTIAPAMRAAQGITLYASSRDEALVISRKWHDAPRAGDSRDGFVVMPGIDTIDVSGVNTSLIGHSHYEIPEVLRDLRRLIGTDPSDRELEELDWEGLPYWRIKTRDS